MLLRRVIEHVKHQNWTAVGLDFLIVVFGVFIGIQVSNWSEARAFKSLERDLLIELQSEIEKSMRISSARKEYLEGVGAAGERSLDFLNANEPCGDECWPVLVDFFHASQWSDVEVSRAVYNEMRRVGLPRSRSVTEAVEAYYAHNDSLSRVFNERPVYRNLVRGLIPIPAQRALWLECHASQEGIERLVSDCSPGVSNLVSTAAVEAIRSNSDIMPTLTQWAGVTVPASPYFAEQNVKGQTAIAVITEELSN